MTISGYCRSGLRPVPSGGDASLLDGERMRGKIQNRQKEDLHGGDDDRRIGEEALIGLVAQTQNESIACQQQGPEEQRAFLSRPEHGELVGDGKVAIAVVVDVSDGKVVVERGRNENERGQRDDDERRNAGAARGFAKAGGSGIASEQCKQACAE